MKKRVLSLFMALALCLTMLPTAAFAETADAAAQTTGGTTDTGGAYTIIRVTIDKDTAAPDQEERDALSVWALRAESSEHAHCVCGVKGCEKWLATYGSHTKTISFSDNAISQDAEGLKINGTVWEKRELKTSDNTVVGYYYRLPAGDYTIEPRSMIDVTVTGANGQRLLHETALNDAVVTKGAIARVVQVSVYCDNVEATSFSGDGVIIATPTGSTAYSMSAGGPIVEPLAKNLIISPICAHAMLAKTIVVSPERVISIKIGKIGRHNAYLSVDGGRAFRLNTGDVITTKASQKVTKLVRLKQTSFFEILNKKFIDRQR